MRFEVLLLLFNVATSLTNIYASTVHHVRPRRSSGPVRIAVDVPAPATIIASGTGTATRSELRRMLHLGKPRRLLDYDSDVSDDSPNRRHHRKPVTGSKPPRRQLKNAPLKKIYRQTTTGDYEYFAAGYDESMRVSTATTTVKSIKNNEKFEINISEQCSDSWTKHFPIIIVAMVIMYPCLCYYCKSRKIKKNMVYLQSTNCHCHAKYCKQLIKR